MAWTTIIFLSPIEVEFTKHLQISKKCQQIEISQSDLSLMTSSHKSPQGFLYPCWSRHLYNLLNLLENI